MTGGSYVTGYPFSNERLEFNFSVEDLNTARNHIGGNARIDGARIYFKESGTSNSLFLFLVRCSKL